MLKQIKGWLNYSDYEPIPHHDLPDYDHDELDLEAQPTFLRTLDEASTLSRKERVIGFAICFLLGWVISLSSLASLSTVYYYPTRFAIVYSIGNFLSLISSLFLYGPMKQLTSMFQPSRIVTTILYLFCMFLTFFFALYGLPIWLVIIPMAVQMLTGLWYSLSFIPYAHDFVKYLLCSCCPWYHQEPSNHRRESIERFNGRKHSK